MVLPMDHHLSAAPTQRGPDTVNPSSPSTPSSPPQEGLNPNEAPRGCSQPLPCPHFLASLLSPPLRPPHGQAPPTFQAEEQVWRCGGSGGCFTPSSCSLTTIIPTSPVWRGKPRGLSSSAGAGGRPVALGTLVACPDISYGQPVPVFTAHLVCTREPRTCLFLAASLRRLAGSILTPRQ